MGLSVFYIIVLFTLFASGGPLSSDVRRKWGKKHTKGDPFDGSPLETLHRRLKGHGGPLRIPGKCGVKLQLL